MDYKKYVKYKQKYLQLIKYQNGGNDDWYIEFIEKNKVLVKQIQFDNNAVYKIIKKMLNEHYDKIITNLNSFKNMVMELTNINIKYNFDNIKKTIIMDNELQKKYIQYINQFHTESNKKVETSQDTSLTKLSNIKKYTPSITPSINYKNTTRIEDYKKIKWTRQSCFFSTSMWFLWSIIPFRKFIEVYSGTNKGFNEIKNLFNMFNDKTIEEPLNIEFQYKNIFNEFIVNLKFGSQESAFNLVQNILEKTNDLLLDQIKLKITQKITCVDNKYKYENKNTHFYPVLPTTDHNIFNVKEELIENFKDCNGDVAHKTDTIELFNESNEYFIVDYINNEDFVQYSDAKEIMYKDKIFKIKALISFQGDIKTGEHGHYSCLIFDDDGSNPFILDDFYGLKEYVDFDNSNYKLNSLVLYKLSNQDKIIGYESKFLNEIIELGLYKINLQNVLVSINEYIKTNKDKYFWEQILKNINEIYESYIILNNEKDKKEIINSLQNLLLHNQIVITGTKIIIKPEPPSKFPSKFPSKSNSTKDFKQKYIKYKQKYLELQKNKIKL